MSATGSISDHERPKPLGHGRAGQCQGGHRGGTPLPRKLIRQLDTALDQLHPARPAQALPLPVTAAPHESTPPASMSAHNLGAQHQSAPAHLSSSRNPCAHHNRQYPDLSRSLAHRARGIRGAFRSGWGNAGQCGRYRWNGECKWRAGWRRHTGCDELICCREFRRDGTRDGRRQAGGERDHVGRREDVCGGHR